jgi:prepilin-type N-terminal cleavage/methylation domain-containing protein
VKAQSHGFTLIELLVVLAIVATLLAIAAPRYFASLDRAREAALRETLFVMRDAIDKHYGDTGRYPDSLEELVTKRYLRKLPPDPVAESAETWVVAMPPAGAGPGGVYDVRSGAEGKGADGTPFAEW